MNTEEKQQVIELCQELIRQKSYSGGEQQAAGVIQRAMKQLGFDAVNTDRYGNVVGCIRGKRSGKKLLFDGHMDTVPVPEESAWKYPPFAAEIHASDMKGALAAMIVAAGRYAKGSRDFAGEIDVAGVVHEECFEGVAAREISRAVKPDYVVIGEASMLNLKIGQRGRAEVVVETFGKSCHSANPEKGNNAVYQMAKIIEEIRGLSPTSHPVLGKGILELTDIKSSPYPGASVVPDYCRATYDRRLLIGETPESVLEPIRKLCGESMAKDPSLHVKVSYASGKETCYTGAEIRAERFFPGWLYDRSEPFVQNVLAQLRGMGYDPAITQYNFCTNGSHYAGEAGIPTIGLGPSREDLAHTTNEFIEIGQLTNAVDCYDGVIQALLKDAAGKGSVG